MPKSEVKLKRRSVNGGIEPRVKAAKNAAVKVGVLRGQGEHPKGTQGQTVAEIAFWNEFGTVRIPPRPFLRKTLADNKAEYKRLFKATLKQILNLRISSDKGIGLLGLKVSTDIKATITSLSTPANSLLTQKLKGSSNPLIHSGTLKRSITWSKI